MLLVKSKVVRLIAGVIETTNLLALRLYIHDKQAARQLASYTYRGYVALARNSKWKSRRIEELFPSVQGSQVCIRYLPGDGVADPVDELAYLALITAALKPKVVFEIGTFRGRTALNFALNSPSDCTIYTLDLPDGGHATGLSDTDSRVAQQAKPGAAYKDAPEAARKIVQLYGDSREFDFSPYHDRADLVFVDAAHHYDAVVSDSINAKKMLRSGGAIVWHDFAAYGEFNDVTRAVLDLFGTEEVIQIGATQLAVYRHG